MAADLVGFGEGGVRGEETTVFASGLGQQVDIFLDGLFNLPGFF